MLLKPSVQETAQRCALDYWRESHLNYFTRGSASGLGASSVARCCSPVNDFGSSITLMCAVRSKNMFMNFLDLGILRQHLG